MQKDIAETIQLLDWLEATAGCGFIWRTTAALLVEESLDDQHSKHIHPFCARVKQKSHEMELTCMKNDSEKISRQALELRVPFINICHAGIAELVIPVFKGDHYLGVVLCGPFRGDQSFCTYSDCLEEFKKLDHLTEAKAEAIAGITRRVVKDASFIMHLADDEDLQIPPVETIQEYRIRNAARFLKKNFSHALSLDAVAAAASLSRSRFQHLFKEQTGLTFGDYLQRLRVGEAKRLLTGTGLQMSEIAAACGFSDQSRFAAIFKRYLKESPTAFRQRFIKQNPDTL
jgi:AraC-like DNA-binding protein/ligand-binding sensor protein